MGQHNALRLHSLSFRPLVRGRSGRGATTSTLLRVELLALRAVAPRSAARREAFLIDGPTQRSETPLTLVPPAAARAEWSRRDHFHPAEGGTARAASRRAAFSGAP